MILIDNVLIELNSAEGRELRQEIIDKVSFLLSCLRGTIPMNREIGMDPDIISMPEHTARNLYTISAIEQINDFEPRAYVDEVVFVPSGSSADLIPKVVLGYNAE